MEGIQFAARGSSGIWVVKSVSLSESKFTENEDFPWDSSTHSKAMCYSQDGKYFAWHNGQSIQVVALPGFNPTTFQQAMPRVTEMKFSPCGTAFITWASYKGGGDNLNVWAVNPTGQNNALIKSFVQKKQSQWEPLFSEDEVICCRAMNDEIQFFESFNFQKPSARLTIPKVCQHSISPGGPPYHLATYVTGVKGQPSSVRVFCYPNFAGLTSCVAFKSFYKADSVSFHWNCKGNRLLVLTVCDTSTQSYYGDQGLHFLSVEGESSLVDLQRDGPIYSVQWHPSGTTFCVVYGYMPAKVTLFNMKCEAVFDYGTGPRNNVEFNPQGNLLALTGFGNLRGNIEIWDTVSNRAVMQYTAPDTTDFSWSPDGQHFLTATTSPRLRVGNGFKIWHYAKGQVRTFTAEENEALWQIVWQPVRKGLFAEFRASHVSNKSTVVGATVKVQAYRPPGMRDETATSTGSKNHSAVAAARASLHDYEPATNVAKQSGEPLSKAAAKNKRKREARKAKQQQQGVPDQQFQQDQHSASQSQHLPACHDFGAISGDVETCKRIRNLHKKLDQISKLKQQQQQGKVLELNQLQKLETETAIIDELNSLQL